MAFFSINTEQQYNHLRYYYHFIRSLFESDYDFTVRKFKKIFKYKLDLKNPKTFNEKLQWKKLYDKNPLYTLSADKVLVRYLVKEKIGEQYLIPTLQITDDAKNIDFDSLPNSFILKANHACGWNKIVRDKSKINRKEIVKICSNWLNHNYYYIGREWIYKNIKPLVIIEELISDETPPDYKFHCFNGEIDSIQYDTGRYKDIRRDFYDENWNKMDLRKNAPNSDIAAPRPEKLEEMKEIARKLSADFDYVRVDLFYVNNKIYFGELSFIVGGGFSPFDPQEYDKKLGDKLNLKGFKNA